MDEKVTRTESITEESQIRRQMIQEELTKLQRRVMMQVSEEIDFEEWCASGEFSMISRKRFRPLKDLKERSRKRTEEKTRVVKELKNYDEVASRFQRKNYELDKDSLLLLRKNINPKDSAKTILEKARSFYDDPSLVDEALDFLIETTEKELQDKVREAKELLRSSFEREVKAGRNIQTEAQEFSKVGLGAPTLLRNLYREITGRQIPIEVLFDDLSKAFTFSKLKDVIKFLFHALGSDLKSKGPSIERAELMKLIDDTKDLQAILGLYRFFRSRMNLITSLFSKNGLILPPRMDFELLSKAFMKLISGRYISVDTAILIGRELGLSKDIIAQIIIFTQMRDATRNTAARLYKSKKRRMETLEALIEYLEELEEKLEEEEEEE